MTKLRLYILLVSVFCFTQTKAQSGLTLAPDFTAKDVTGFVHTLSNYLNQNKIVVLPFFTTTCGSCNIYSPEIVLSHQDFGCNQGNVFFLGINWGTNNIGVIDFISAHAVGYPCVSGLQGSGNEVNELYEIASHITCLVIMPDGEIAGQFYGPNTYPTRDSLNSLLISLGAEMYDCSLGTNQLKKTNSSLNIYPNPASFNTKLKLEIELNGYYEIEIRNITGQVIESCWVNIDTHQSIIKLNLETFLKGLYFVHLKQNGFIISTKKLLKI